MRFKNNVVIVTGSSRGIGKSIAIEFAREGADVVLSARSVEKSVDGFGLPGTILETAEEVRSLGRRALPIKADVSIPSEVEEMTRQTVREFGRLDVLVNNPAFTNVSPTSFHEMTIEECDLQIATTFKGVLNCCRAVVPQMISQKGGRIVNVTTAGAKIPAPFLSIYTSFTESW
jgi:3-oxoacyl-[acyl-carrier protein] reductase